MLFSNGYTQGLTSEIIKLAKKDNIGFAYGEKSIIEYSVNLAPHQSNLYSLSKHGCYQYQCKSLWRFIIGK